MKEQPFERNFTCRAFVGPFGFSPMRTNCCGRYTASSTSPRTSIPSERGILIRLVGTWNDFTGRKEAVPDVLHYMITRRKNGEWERLGRNAGHGLARPWADFSEEELKHLDSIHEELQIASDNFALNSELAQRLQQEFARRTNRIVPPMILAATMINRRKIGALATLRPKVKDQDLGFSDMDEVAK